MIVRTLISGGVVVFSDNRRKADVLIEDGIIVEVGEVDAGSAETVIDAEGLHVLPGLVDAHVHVRDPGLTHKEDFASASAAAVTAGVTTMLVMPFDIPVVTDPATLEQKSATAQGRIHCDVGLQAAIGAGSEDRIGELVAAGAVSLELLLGVDPDSAPSVSTAAEIRSLLMRAAEHDALVGISCEDLSLVNARTEELVRAGRRDMSAFIQSRDEAGEIIAVTMACALAAETGARIHLRQVSLPWSIEIIEHYVSEGASISYEITPHNLLLDAQWQSNRGPEFKVVPPLRSTERVHELQRRILDGAAAIIATDHAPHTRAEKARGIMDIWAAPGGLPGLETLLYSMLAWRGTEGLEWIASSCAQKPAERFGIGARKGRVAVGYDADLVLLDAQAQVESVSPLHTRAGYSVFAPDQLRGRITQTLLRGAVVAQDHRMEKASTGRVLTPAHPLDRKPHQKEPK